MKRLIPRVITLAIFMSVLLVNIVYADVTSAHMTDTPGGAEMTQLPPG